MSASYFSSELRFCDAAALRDELLCQIILARASHCIQHSINTLTTSACQRHRWVRPSVDGCITDADLVSSAPENFRLRHGAYAGIDPTASSLHLGHLLPLMVLFWFHIHGHNTVTLIGGATAQVGDPSGRLTSRLKTQSSTQRSNTQSIHTQVGRLWERAETCARRHGHEILGRRTILNNEEWLSKLNIMDFLHTLGSGMRIGAMLGRDTWVDL